MNNEIKVATIWRAREIVANIDDITSQIENYEGDCCGMACSCYENLLIDIENSVQELKELGYVYQNGQLLRDDSIWHERF